MTNTEALKRKIKSEKLSKRKLAKMLNLSESGLYLKLNNKREFRASEIRKLKDALKLTVAETVQIFLEESEDAPPGEP